MSNNQEYYLMTYSVSEDSTGTDFRAPRSVVHNSKGTTRQEQMKQMFRLMHLDDYPDLTVDDVAVTRYKELNGSNYLDHDDVEWTYF